MNKVGRQLPRELRETGLGGLAGTATGQRMKNEIFEKSKNSPLFKNLIMKREIRCWI